MKVLINNVNKYFENHRALSDVNLFIEPGTIHGVLGSNGAGKTTLMKTMAGIYKVDSGSVTYDDKDVFESVDVKSDIIFLADIPYFFRNASLKSQAEFYKGLYPNFSTTRYKKLRDHFTFNDKKPLNQMSKGMKRQAAFILAFASRPKVMILDEPFDGLDPIIRKQMKSIMMQDIAQNNLTIIASSHNLREMEDICDSVSIIHNGELLFHQDLSEVKGSHCKVQIAFKALPDDSFFDNLNVVSHKENGRILTCIIKGNLDKVEEKITQYNYYMYDILPLTLEEIFAYEMGEKGYEIHNIILE